MINKDAQRYTTEHRLLNSMHDMGEKFIKAIDIL